MELSMVYVVSERPVMGLFGPIAGPVVPYAQILWGLSQNEGLHSAEGGLTSDSECPTPPFLRIGGPLLFEQSAEDVLQKQSIS